MSSNLSLQNETLQKAGFNNGVRNVIQESNTQGFSYSDILGQIPDKSIPNSKLISSVYDAIVDINGEGDFTSIQEALDSGANKIFIKNGTYTISTSLKITRDGINLVGESNEKTILDGSSVSNIIEIGSLSSSANEFLIENFNFYGDIGTNGILIYKTSNSQIIKNKFDSINTCINADNLSEYSNIFINNNIFNNVVIAAYFDGNVNSVNNLIITNNYILSTGSSYGFYLFRCDYSVISNNIFNNCNGAITTGSSRNNIINNIIYNSTLYAIYILGDYINVNNNIISSTNTHGIIIDRSHYCNICNNIIKDSSQLENNIYSDIILYDTGSTTYNNICCNNISSIQSKKSKYGIYEESTIDDYNIISNNIVQGAVTANILSQGANTIVGDNIA